MTLDKQNKINFLINEEYQCITNEVFNKNICNFIIELSRNILKTKEARLYPDLMSFAYWCRSSNLNKYRAKYKDNNLRIGVGTIFHITASNVPTNFAYSFIFGLVSGNSNIIRMSSNENEQANIFFRVIKNLFKKKEYQELKQSNIFIQYDHDKDITQYYSSFCDARIIWGGDDTINEIRNFKLKENARDITFPDRYSLSIFDGRSILKLEDNELNNLINNFYNDTYFIDQNACSSPQLIIWLNDNKDVAKHLFWNKLKMFLCKYDIDEASDIEKYTNLCKIAAVSNNISKIKIENKKLSIIKISKLNQNIFDIRGFCGSFVEYNAKKLQDISLLSSNIVQTLTYFGIERNDILNIINKHKLKGFDRVVPVGKALEMDMVWDGYELPYTLSRIIN